MTLKETKDITGTLGLKAIVCSKLVALFCGSLGDTSVERNTDDGDLACEGPEGNLNHLKTQGLRIF